MKLELKQIKMIKRDAMTENTARYAIECMGSHTFRERMEYARTGDLPKSSKTLKW